MAVAAGAGRGRPSVIGEGAAEAAARRSPLRETFGKIGERLSRVGERIGEAIDRYAARAERNVRRAVENGRRNELGTLGEIPENIGGGPKNFPDVALGKWRNGLVEFSEKVRARNYKEWYSHGLVDEPVGEANFSVPFNQATSRAGRIKFNIEGVDIEAARSMEGRLSRSFDPIRHSQIKGQGLITEWELRQVLSNKSLFEKADFYYGAHTKFTASEAASMGLSLMEH